MGKAVPYSERPDAAETLVKTYEAMGAAVQTWNTNVEQAAGSDTAASAAMRIDEGWATQQKTGALNRLLADLTPYKQVIFDVNANRLAAVPKVDQAKIRGIIEGYYRQFPKGAPKCTSPQLQVLGHSPFTLYVTDQAGRGTGVAPRTGAIVQQIPGSSYSGPLASTQAITIPYPSGNYAAQMKGTGSGQYGLELRALQGQTVASSASLSGTISGGELLWATAVVSATGTQPVMQVTSLSSTFRVYLPALTKSYASGW